MSTAAPPMPLAYGRRRRRGRRLVGWGLLVTLLAAGGLAHHWRGRWLPPVRHRWDLYQLTRSQARCLAFTPPPGQVVFTDAADAAVGPDAGRITSDGYTAVLWRPPVWRDFLDRARVEDPYTETFASWFAPSMPVPPAADLLFCPCLLHERQLPNGDRVLACVTVSVTHTSANLNGFYWLPGSSTSPPRHMPAETIEIAKANSADALTIEAARLDPADPTRFDIPYRVGDRSGVVHGRMDRGGVTFEPDAGWWVPGEGIWTTDGTGVRLHQRTTPDYVLPYPPGVARVMPDVRPAQLAFTADGRRLLAVLAEPKPTRVVVWDLATRKLCGEVGLNTEGRPADTAYIRVDPVLSPDGRLCVSVVNGYTGGAGPTRYFSFIRGIDVSTGREVGQTPVRPSATRPVGFSPDGQSIYFGSGGRLWLVNTTSWAERASTVLHGELGEAAVGPSHVAVMTGPVEAYGYVRADRLTIFGADLLAVACPPTPPIYNFTFAPDGHQLFTYAYGPGRLGLGAPPAGLYTIDVATGISRRLSKGGPFGPAFDFRLAESTFSRDGRWWAACGSPGDQMHTYLFTYPDFGDVWRLATPAPNCYTVPAFSPDSRRLATATETGISIWSIPAANPPPSALPTPADGR